MSRMHSVPVCNRPCIWPGACSCEPDMPQFVFHHGMFVIHASHLYACMCMPMCICHVACCLLHMVHPCLLPQCTAIVQVARKRTHSVGTFAQYCHARQAPGRIVPRWVERWAARACRTRRILRSSAQQCKGLTESWLRASMWL